MQKETQKDNLGDPQAEEQADHKKALKAEAGEQEDHKKAPKAEAEEQEKKAPKPERPRLPTRDEFDLLVRRANHGDCEAQARLGKMLDAHPVIWKEAGDLAIHAQQSLISLISKGECFLGESLKRRLAELRRDLETPFASPLEKLAVERVVAAWANLYYVEAAWLKVEDLAERKYWLKKQDQAHRQYLAATKSLMLVQSMLERSAPAPPLTARSRFRMAGSPAAPAGNGPGGNGHAGSTPVPAFAMDEDAGQQVGSGHSTNRIAELVGP